MPPSRPRASNRLSAMKRVLKGLAITAGCLAAILVVAAAAVYGASESRYRKTYTVPAERLVMPTDSAAIARGAHIAQSIGGCQECHGETLAGKPVLDDRAIGRVYAPNLTSGRGGIASLSDDDIARAIRHGVAPNGRALKIMPSSDFANLTDADLGAIVAYVRSRPAMDNVVPPVSVGPLGRALFLAGKLPILHAERIDHGRVHAATITPAPTAEYGAYLASVGCMGCHGPQFAGGHIASGPPDWPPAANLTAAGRLPQWDEAAFRRVLREGKRPDGSTVNPVMPVRATTHLSDDEITALWLYLRTLPAVATR